MYHICSFAKQHICVFCMNLIIKSNYCPKQQKLVGLYHGDTFLCELGAIFLNTILGNSMLSKG